MDQVQTGLSALGLQQEQQDLLSAAKSTTPSDFPVQTLTAVKDICGVSTQLVVSFYSNMIFVIVSQLGSIGSLVSLF
jgi:hypothetical protein